MIRRILAAAALLSVAACGDDDEFAGETRAANACVPNAAGNALDLEEVAGPGEHEAGELQLTFVDTTRGTPAHGDYAGAADRTLDVRVYYPATAAGSEKPAASGGPFPVLMYSHGFSSSAGENPAMFRILASHGYVVVSPRFPASAIDAEGGPTTMDIAEQPRDVSFVLDRVLELSDAGHAFLGGLLDETRVAAGGLSMGGLTTLLVTFHAELRDPRIDLAIAVAPRAGVLLPSFYETTNVPVLVLFGTYDAILPYVDNAVPFRDRARAPRTLLTFVDGTHTGFTAVATLFDGVPGYENVDSIGCSVVDTGDGSERWDDLEELLGAENGVATQTPVGEFCPDEMPPAMGPLRQIELETAAFHAQLDAYFAPDAKTRGRACHFVERVLPREDDVDIDRL